MKDEKYLSLLKYLKDSGKVAIAFSGGVDSTFLLKAAKEALGNEVIAVTVKAPYMPEWEFEEAKEFVEELGVEFLLIEVPILDSVRNNPEDRCYICKKAVFTMIKDTAAKKGCKYVLDGTNFDDTKDYRPGLRALKELDIRSPLLELAITKQEIRDYSKKLNLKTWDKPPYACLLSRIPYGTIIKEDELKRIEKSEKYIIDLGLRSVRVRSHGNVARIELPKNEMSKLFDLNIMDSIAEKLKEFGYNYVSLDMQGYRMGSLNETILK